MNLACLRTNLLLARLADAGRGKGSGIHVESQTGHSAENAADNTNVKESSHPSNENISTSATAHHDVPSTKASDYHTAIYQISNDVMRQALTDIHEVLQSCLIDSKDDAGNISGKAAIDMLKIAVKFRPTTQSLSSDMEYAGFVARKCRRLANEFRSLREKCHELDQADNGKLKSILARLDQEFQSKLEQEKNMFLKEMSLNERICEEKIRIIHLEYQRKMAIRDQQISQLESRFSESCRKHDLDKTELMVHIRRMEDALKLEQKKVKESIEERENLHQNMMNASAAFHSERTRLLARVEDLEDRLMDSPCNESHDVHGSTLIDASNVGIRSSAWTDKDPTSSSGSSHHVYNRPSRMEVVSGDGDADCLYEYQPVHRRKPVPLRQLQFHPDTSL